MFDEEHICSIDPRIKASLVEHPDDPDDKYYVKIWFDFVYTSENMRGGRQTGNHEFTGETKELVTDKIKEFLNEDKDQWRIV